MGELSRISCHQSIAMSKQAVRDMMMWPAGDEELNNYDEYVIYPPPLECLLNVAGSRQAMR